MTRRPLYLALADRLERAIRARVYSKGNGWICPGRFAPQVTNLALSQGICRPGLNQAIIAEFLRGGAYDRHLQRLRPQLQAQLRQTTAAVERHFPANVRLTRPAGGFFLWAQLHPNVSSETLFRQALTKRIAILPGVLTSTSSAFNHYIRLNCGTPFTAAHDQAIEQLGELIAATRAT